MSYFSALQEIDKISHFRIYTPDIQTNTFLYSSLMQTGANVIEIISDPSNLLEHSKAIKKRVIESNKKDYGELSSTINKIFSKYTKKAEKSNKKLVSTLENAQVFIVDLLFSARRGSDFLFAGELPNIKPFKSFLQPDLYCPLQNILSLVTTQGLFVSSPISSILKSEVTKFDSIINSDIYLEYSKSHKLLEIYSLKKIADSIKLNTEKLIAANPTLLSIYNNLTSLIPLSKLVDPKFGELAQTANSVLTKLSDSNNRQNIVIYMYRDIMLVG